VACNGGMGAVWITGYLRGWGPVWLGQEEKIRGGEEYLNISKQDFYCNQTNLYGLPVRAGGGSTTKGFYLQEGANVFKMSSRRGLNNKKEENSEI